MSQGAWRNRTRRRRGMLIHEAVVALSLIAVVLVGVAQLLALTAQQRRSAEQRACAVREAGNVMDRMMACPWNDTEPQAAAVQVSETAASQLPESRLSVEVLPEGEAEQIKRIAVRIDWRNAAGQQGHPVRLVGWRHRLAPPPGDLSPSEPTEDQE